jgi:hypothetical protein
MNDDLVCVIEAYPPFPPAPSTYRCLSRALVVRTMDRLTILLAAAAFVVEAHPKYPSCKGCVWPVVFSDGASFAQERNISVFCCGAA